MYNLKYITLIFLIIKSHFIFGNELCPNAWKIGIFENPPMQAFANGIANGYNIDMISELAKRVGCKVFFSEVPWPRQFVEVASGKLDVVLGGGKRPDREKLLYYGRPDINGPSVIIFYKEDKNFKSFKLNQIMKLNLKIGAQVGSQYSDEYTNLMKNTEFSSKIELSTRGENLIKKFRAKRIDGMFFGDIFTAKIFLKDDFKKNKLLVFPVTENDYAYIAYSKKTFTIENVKELDQELKKIINDGNQLKIIQIF